MTDKSPNSTFSCSQTNELLSGYIDNELTQQQQQRVALHIEQCQKCQGTVDRLTELQHTIKGNTMPVLEQEQIDAILNEPKSKLMQTVSWGAIIIGVSILVAYVLIAFLFNPAIGVTEKVVSSLIWGGLFGLFISVLRQRIIARKTDKYKGVKL